MSRGLFHNDENSRYTFNIAEITEDFSYGSIQNHNTADALREQGRVSMCPLPDLLALCCII